MTRNEGGLDRGARTLMGLILLSQIFVGMESMWGLVGIIPLATGLVGYCPVYRVLGVNTCSLKQ
jgi:hypothetical protein